MIDPRLILGDCLDILPTLADGSTGLIVTSPPYNCRKQYGDYDDQLPWPMYYDWMGKVLRECYRLLEPGGTLAVVVPGVIRWQADHRYADTWSDYDANYKTHRNGEQVIGKGRIEPLGFRLFDMMREIDSHMREPVIWVKGSEDRAIASEYRMGCDSDPYMRPTHEMILLGSKGRWFHRGGTGRRGAEAVPFLEETKDVYFVPPVSSKKHPAPFPVEIPLRLIRLFTHAEDAVVLDPFMGIGAVGVAAIQTGRGFIGIDRCVDFVDEAKRKMEDEKRRLEDERLRASQLRLVA